MPPLLRGPEKDLAAQFEKLCKELPKAIAKRGRISLPDIILNSVKGAVRRYRKGSQLIPSKYIESLIPLLDADGYNTCKRLSVKVFITIVEAILQTEPCRQGERGLYLLGAGLYHAVQQDSQGNSAAADKVEIGKDCMHVLLVYFTNPKNSLEGRQWVGTIMLQLLKDCSTNVEKLTTGSADCVCLLGKFLIEEVNEILKLVFGEVINVILNTKGPEVDRKELWPKDVNPTAYNGFPVGDSQIGQGWNRKFDNYLSDMADLRIIETPALNNTMFWSLAVATEPEHDVGIPGRNVSVFVDAKKITILAPISATEFYTCLEIPFEAMKDYRADYETTYSRSQNPDEFADLVITLESHEKECFCYKNSTAVELEGVRLTFLLAAVDNIIDDIEAACSRLDINLESSSPQRLELEEYDSSPHALKNNEISRTQEDNISSGNEQGSYSGTVATRKLATASIATVEVTQVESESGDYEIDLVQTEPAGEMNNPDRQLNASTAIIDDESGSEDSFRANLLKPQHELVVVRREDEDKLSDATPPPPEAKRSSRDLAGDPVPSSGAMSSLDKLKSSFRVPSRVKPIPKPSLGNNSSLPATQRDLRSQRPTQADMDSSPSKSTETALTQTATKDDPNISKDNSIARKKEAGSKTQAKQQAARHSKAAGISVNEGDDDWDKLEKKGASEAEGEKHLPRNTKVDDVSADEYKDKSAMLDEKAASKARRNKQAPRNSNASDLSVDEIEDDSDVLEKETASTSKGKKQPSKNSKAVHRRSNKTIALKSKTPLETRKPGTQSQSVKTAGATQPKHKEPAKNNDIYDLPENNSSPVLKKVGRKPPRKAPIQNSQTRVAEGEVDKAPKLQKQKNKGKSAQPQSNPRPLKSQRSAAKIANKKLQEVNEKDDPFEEQSVVPTKRGTNADTGSDGESKAEAEGVSSRLKQRGSSQKDVALVTQDVEKDNTSSSQKEHEHDSGPFVNDEHQSIQDFDNSHGNDLYDATPRVSRQKREEKHDSSAEVPTISPTNMGKKMARRLVNMLNNVGETESDRANIQPGHLQNKSTELRMTQARPEHVARKLSPAARSSKVLSKPTDLAAPPKSQLPKPIATAQMKVITDQKLHKGEPRLHEDFMKDDLAVPNNTSPQISMASGEEDEILGLGKTAAEVQNSNPQTITGVNDKPIIVQEDDGRPGSDSGILPDTFDGGKVQAPEFASGTVPHEAFKIADKPRQNTSREQTASANNKVIELAPGVNDISRSKADIVASQSITEKEDYVAAPVPESTDLSVQKQRFSFDRETQTPRSDKKRKAKDVDMITAKRVRLATDADGQVSPLRRSPRLHAKSQIHQLEASQKSKNTQRSQPLTSLSTKHNPHSEAAAIEAAAALNKVLSMSMPLVNDALVRKPAIINFGANGPRNQGASSVSRSSGKAKGSLSTQQIEPAINDKHGNKETVDTKTRVTSQAEGFVSPIESTIHGAALQPINLITNRKRAKAGFQEESLGPPRKRHSPSPPETTVMVNNDSKVSPQPVSPPSVVRALEKISPPQIQKQDVPTAPQRQSSRLGSQSSRVDLNGSPIATARVDHISKIKKKLQPSDEPCVDGRQEDTSLAQNSYPMRSLSEEASIMFGPRVPLSSLSKPKPALPDTEEVRYIPHKKNTRTGAYEEVGTMEAIAPQKVLPDPFLEKETRRLSKFTQRLQEVEPNRSMPDEKRLLIASTVARVFDGEQDSSPAQKPTGEVEHIEDVIPRTKNIETHMSNTANTNILEGVDRVFDEIEDEQTLVGNESTNSHKISSPAGLTSGSSNISPDKGAPESPLSEISTSKVWNGALRPHYRPLYDGVQRIVDELFAKLQTKEHAIEARIDEYRVNGTKLLIAFDEQRQVDRQAVLQDIDTKRKDLIEVFHGAMENLSRSVEEIERSPLDAYEQEWQKRQEDIERGIANARRSLGI